MATILAAATDILWRKTDITRVECATTFPLAEWVERVVPSGTV